MNSPCPKKKRRQQREKKQKKILFFARPVCQRVMQIWYAIMFPFQLAKVRTPSNMLSRNTIDDGMS